MGEKKEIKKFGQRKVFRTLRNDTTLLKITKENTK